MGHLRKPSPCEKNNHKQKSKHENPLRNWAMFSLVVLCLGARKFYRDILKAFGKKTDSYLIGTVLADIRIDGAKQCAKEWCVCSHWNSRYLICRWHARFSLTTRRHEVSFRRSFKNLTHTSFSDLSKHLRTSNSLREIKKGETCFERIQTIWRLCPFERIVKHVLSFLCFFGDNFLNTRKS